MLQHKLKNEHIYIVCLRESVELLNQLMMLHPQSPESENSEKSKKLNKSQNEVMKQVRKEVLKMFGWGIMPKKEVKKLKKLFSFRNVKKKFKKPPILAWILQKTLCPKWNTFKP